MKQCQWDPTSLCFFAFLPQYQKIDFLRDPSESTRGKKNYLDLVKVCFIIKAAPNQKAVFSHGLPCFHSMTPTKFYLERKQIELKFIVLFLLKVVARFNFYWSVLYKLCS